MEILFKHRLHLIVNPRKTLTLPDFEESTFAGENAKNSGFCAKMAFNSRRVYHSDFNHETAPRKSARGRCSAPQAGVAGWNRLERMTVIEIC